MTEPWIVHGAVARHLTPYDFEQAAERIGCSPAAVEAVFEVEAGGRFFGGDAVISRFEPHHMPRETWGYLGFEPGDAAPWRAALRLSDKARRAMFKSAAAIDPELLMRASSWGAPQIMGFNAQACGFDTAREMVEHMALGAPQQLGAWVQFVEAKGLDAKIRAHDWRGFAEGYNGSGQPEVYARKIEAVYRRLSGGQASAVILRVGARGPAVRELQRALGVEDDGAFGPGTERAVRDFQRSAGLPVDGVVGHRTWSAIREAGISVQPSAQPTPGAVLADAAVKGGGVVLTGGAVLTQVEAAATTLTRVRESLDGVAAALGAEIGLVMLGAGAAALAFGGWRLWRERRLA